MTSIIEQFEVTGTHFEVGQAIGRRFAPQIQRLLATYEFFQQQLLPYHRTAEGQVRYQQFLEINRSRYPDYLAELEGLAHGAGCAFEDLFLINLRGEYRDYFYQYAHGCSDCAVVTAEVALIGHNEDGDPAFRDNMYLVHVKIKDKPAFTALSYPGFLCGNAFGFNRTGICFSVDNVRPLAGKPGLGRHFVARSLFEATSLADAIRRVTVPNQASGFHYTIGSLAERRVVGVEVAPGAHTLREIQGCYFHANHYQDLEVTQHIEPSSQARVERSEVILSEHAPADAAGILAVLGDQANQDYPIYGTPGTLYPLVTLYTVLFDLDRRCMRLYPAHPTRAPAEFIEVAM